jgi:hypothetical protein
MTVPSHLEYVVDGKPFQLDPTGVTYGTIHFPIEEILRWSLGVHKVTTNFVPDWRFNFRCLRTPVEAGGTNLYVDVKFKREIIQPAAEFDSMCTNIVQYSTSHLTPRVASRKITAVLQGETVKLEELEISREGIIVEEGKLFRKKQKVTYPWSAYLGLKELNRVQLRVGDETILAWCGGAGKGIGGDTVFRDHGIQPLVLNALAQYFRE